MSLAYNIFMDTLTAPFKMSPNQYSCITSPNNIPRLQIRGVSSTITVKMGFPAKVETCRKSFKNALFHSYPVGWRTCCTCTTSLGSCSRRRWVSWPCHWPRKGRKTSCLQFFNYCSSISTTWFCIYPYLPWLPWHWQMEWMFPWCSHRPGGNRLCRDGRSWTLGC